MKTKILLKDRQDMTRAWARGKQIHWPEVEQQENERKKIKKVKTGSQENLRGYNERDGRNTFKNHKAKTEMVSRMAVD